LNQNIALTSWPLPSLDQTLDKVSEQRLILVINRSPFGIFAEQTLTRRLKTHKEFETHETKYVFYRLPMSFEGPNFVSSLDAEGTKRHDVIDGHRIFVRHVGPSEGPNTNDEEAQTGVRHA
jgi:hypothetical protein